MAHALGRHLVLVGFKGAGKTTIGEEVARRLDRPFRDIDREIEVAHGPIAELFAKRGEAAFRELEAHCVMDAFRRREATVVAVGGGAVETSGLLADLDALVVRIDVDVDTGWERARGTGRTFAQDEGDFRLLFERRRPLYQRVADASASDVDGVVLAAAGVRFASHEEARGDGIVADARVAELHGIEADHRVPPGEAAKTIAEAEQLWRALGLERASTLLAVGGGTTTDLVGFVAATYLRGVAWVAVPSTLVGMVDAAIGGKTGIDLPSMKNAVGAFHWPTETVVDTNLLRTLPEEEWANGRAEVIKTGLLAAERVWELDRDEMIRRCASFKAGICMRDPFERGARAQLNLGHTFAHALEAASEYKLPHGRAVALGLTAALRLSGLREELQVVDDLLRPEPIRVERDAAWAALLRDKKGIGGTPRLVLLEAPGRPVWGVEMAAHDVRAALDELIV